jgi:hypothetical protein
MTYSSTDTEQHVHDMHGEPAVYIIWILLYISQIKHNKKYPGYPEK